MKDAVKKVLNGETKETLEQSSGAVYLRNNAEYEYNAKQIVELEKVSKSCEKSLAELKQKQQLTVKGVFERIFNGKEVKAAQAEKQRQIESLETEAEAYRVNIGALGARNSELAQEIENFLKEIAELGITPQEVASNYQFMLKELNKPKVEKAPEQKKQEPKKSPKSAIERFNSRMEKHIEMTQNQK